MMNRVVINNTKIDEINKTVESENENYIKLLNAHIDCLKIDINIVKNLEYRLIFVINCH